MSLVFLKKKDGYTVTLPKTNIPLPSKKLPSQQESSLPITIFHWLC